MYKLITAYLKEGYPYCTHYPRTDNWWVKDWIDISEWCEVTLGKDQWDYFSPYFVFKEEESKTLFLLRWQRADSK